MRQLSTAIAMLGLLVVVTCGCNRHGSDEGKVTVAVSQHGDIPQRAQFVDVSARAGLSYHWSIDAKRPLNILQTIGNGCAFLDFDGDGNLDVLLVGEHVALYRGDGHGHFIDVSAPSGLSDLHGHFLGCAVGDYDNDGFPDIYLSGYRTGVLLHNEHGKRFTDVTVQSGLKPQPWGTSCSFCDADCDGLLDLYVCNYVAFGQDTVPQLCKSAGILTACSPLYYEPERGVLYHNRGSGRFEEVTNRWGANSVSGKALGVASAPRTEGAGVQIAIANDEEPGDLLIKQNQQFVNIGQNAGIGYGPTGHPQGGMGIDWGDYDNDGRLELFVATFESEVKPIYHACADTMQFEDRAASLGAADPLLRSVSFGAKWFDFDNDGWLDLIVSNGHISDNVADFNRSQTYRQPTALLHNEAGSRFTDVSAAGGPDIRRPIVGRGLATGDFDNDGRVDVVVVDSEGAPLLLHNEMQNTGHWIMLKLEGTGKSNRDAFGATVTAAVGGKKLLRFCHSDGSYLSSSDPRVHIGLGTETAADISIVWPDGHKRSYSKLAADRIYRIREGDETPHPVQ